MAITYHDDIEQHSDEWRQLRCGLLTASEMDLIITPAKLQVANNDKSRSHLYELAAQRVNNYVEPTWTGGAMERGLLDEIDARDLYSTHYAPIREVGFVTNNRWGFTLGYSPDGLVGERGQWENKSRAQKYQFQTIIDGLMPVDFLIQVQTGLIVTERDWCDFTSFCSGMPMMTRRIYPDEKVQTAIIQAATIFHEQLEEKIALYRGQSDDGEELRFLPTERRPAIQEMHA